MVSEACKEVRTEACLLKTADASVFVLAKYPLDTGRTVPLHCAAETDAQTLVLESWAAGLAPVPSPEPLTLFSADWFLCVASKMVMNCRYWGLVQRPMPRESKLSGKVGSQMPRT